MPEPHDSLWVALEGLTRPVTKESALACARSILTGKAIIEFEKWLGAHEDYLLGRLNG